MNPDEKMSVKDKKRAEAIAKMEHNRKELREEIVLLNKHISMMKEDNKANSKVLNLAIRWCENVVRGEKEKLKRINEHLENTHKKLEERHPSKKETNK